MLSYREQITRFFILGSVENAQSLLHRIRNVDSFNVYVGRNKWLVAFSVLVILFVSLACLLGIFTLLPEMHWLLVIPLLVLLPVFLAGSLFVQALVFFSWIEGRSLARMLRGRRTHEKGPVSSWLYRKLRLDMSPFPQVPWIMTSLFLLLPLALLWQAWSSAAMVAMAAGIVSPIVYASLDR